MSAPVVPVIVNGWVPGASVDVVVTASAREPLVTTDAGLNDAEAPTGSPDVLRSTVPANPLLGLTVTV